MPRSTSCSCLWLAALSVTLLTGAACHAQKIELPAKDAPLEEVSRAQFASRVQELEKVVAECRLAVSACAVDVGADERVAADGSHIAFLEHWTWLREAMQAALKQKENERADAMSLAATHLHALEVEADPRAAAGARMDGDRVSSKAKEVLQRAEFRPAAAQQPSWIQRKMAQFWMWFGGLFVGAQKLGEALPWLGKVLEWGFFLLAAVGLLLFIRRSFARQQLQIALSSGAVQFSAWEREANDWASEADACAANSEWRDAVHCLYWAAIVRLEAKRAWRHNPSRTPREYVRLLQQGSPQQSALRSLTGIFERVWYGLRDAEARDYERAKSLFAELSQGAQISVAAAGER